MGEIYKGHVVETGDPVAIKMMFPELSRMKQRSHFSERKLPHCIAFKTTPWCAFTSLPSSLSFGALT